MAKVKPVYALLLVAALTGGAFAYGSHYVSAKEKEYAAYEEGMAETQMKSFVSKLMSGDYSGLYENSIDSSSLISKEAYETRLSEVLEGIDESTVSWVQMDDETYNLYTGDQLIAAMGFTENEDGTFSASIPLSGNDSIEFEMPVGVTPTINGVEIGDEYIVEKDVAASNFFVEPTKDYVVNVNVYKVDGLLGEAQVNEEDGYAMMQDCVSKRYLVGKEVTDSATLEKIISDAQYLALYPCNDTTWSNIQALADTSATWYSRYYTIPPYWFTSHNTYNFSNQEVLKCIQQSDDTMVAQVIFDYYAAATDVDRTWHCGYQLTYRKINGEWKVCATEINSLLNPAQKW